MNSNAWRQWIRNHQGLSMGLAAVILLILIWVIWPHRNDGPFNPSGTSQGLQVVGFYENKTPGSANPSSLVSFQSHWRQLNSISPHWFQVNPDGSVTDLGYDAALVNWARQHHVSVVPLVTNGQGLTDVLWTHATRQLAAKNLDHLMQQDHLDGVNVDFELLNPDSRHDLSRFVADVSSYTKPHHKTLAVSVFPLVGLPSSVNGADDYAALAKSANYLVIMAYDHHYSGGPPGPVAPWGWVEDNIKAALKEAPASHLMLAIGMYGYDWVDNGQPGSANTVPDFRAQQLANQYGATIHYISDISQNEFRYTTGGTPHIVYYMGDRSAKARVALAARYHLAGVALWRLGYEEPGFWSVIPTR